MTGMLTPLSPASVEALTLAPTAYVTAANITHGEPAERGHVVYASPDEKFLVGVWAAEPYGESFPDGYPGDEFAHVLSGRLTLIEPDGASRSFGPGDSYVMTKGWAGTFRVDASFTKYFVLYLA